MTSHMTIGKKLFMGFGIALALSLIVGGVAYWSLTSLDNAVDRLVTVHAKNQFSAGRITMFLSDLLSAERGIVAASYANDRPTVEQCSRDFREALTAWKTAIAELRPLTETAEARKILDDMQIAAESLAGMHENLYQQVRTNKTEAAAELLNNRVLPSWNQVNQAADRLVEQQGSLMAAANRSTDEQVTASRWITIATIVLSIVVAVVIALVVRKINASLRQMITELAEGTEQVASAASQVSSSSQSLAQGASEQASSLEETSAAGEEIKSMARRNSEMAHSASDVTTQSQQKYEHTNKALEQMVVAMSEINDSSDKISKIIKVIDEISFQTNILALNAAVEAARAGEAGMGFAVVADEVRNLAQRCAQAAKDTAALIEDSIAKSGEGKTKVNQVAEAIRGITEDTLKVKSMVDEVHSGSQEQARGIEQIFRAMVQMEQVTQTTAATAEESASAAEELNAQSESLQHVVQRLTAMVGRGAVGQSGRAAACRTTRVQTNQI